MSQKIPCVKCGTSILPSTAERNSGLCAPCFKEIKDLPEKFKRIAGRINEARNKHHALRKTTIQLEQRRDEAKEKLDEYTNFLSNKEAVYKEKIQSLEGAVKSLEDKIQNLTMIHRNKILKHTKGIIMLLMLLVSVSIVAYLVFYTIQTASKIEIQESLLSGRRSDTLAVI